MPLPGNSCKLLPPLVSPSAGGRNGADDGAILLLVLPREKNKTTKVKTSLKKKKSLVIVPALTLHTLLLPAFRVCC